MISTYTLIFWAKIYFSYQGAIIFYQEGGRLFVGGGKFFGVVKGETIFSVRQMGGPEFFDGQIEETKILFIFVWKR